MEDNVAVVFWVVLFVAVPVAALVLARRMRMTRHSKHADKHLTPVHVPAHPPHGHPPHSHPPNR
jgi:hypothetical protein